VSGSISIDKPAEFGSIGKAIAAGFGFAGSVGRAVPTSGAVVKVGDEALGNGEGAGGNSPLRWSSTFGELPAAEGFTGGGEVEGVAPSMMRTARELSSSCPAAQCEEAMISSDDAASNTVVPLPVSRDRFIRYTCKH